MATTALNCTQCGAPLALHGGRQIESITCEYCNAIHGVTPNEQAGEQANDDLDLTFLATLSQTRQFHTNLTLGTTMTLKGIEFVTIAILEYGCEGEYWQEFCLFSGTHGYAWLSHAHGHYTFSHRVRNVDAVGNVILHRGTSFAYHDTYHAELCYVAGELPWLAAIGDTTKVTEYHMAPLAVCVETSSKEVEYHLEEYIPETALPEILQTPQYGTHPLWTPSKLSENILSACRWGLLIAIVGYLLTPFFGERQLHRTTLSAAANDMLKLHADGGLRNYEITLQGKVSQALTSHHIVLTPLSLVPTLEASAKKTSAVWLPPEGTVDVGNLMLSKNYRAYRHSGRALVSASIAFDSPEMHVLWVKRTSTLRTPHITLKVTEFHRTSYFVWLFVLFLLPLIFYGLKRAKKAAELPPPQARHTQPKWDPLT